MITTAKRLGHFRTDINEKQVCIRSLGSCGVTRPRRTMLKDRQTPEKLHFELSFAKH